MYNFLIYLIVFIIVIWAIEGINFNGVFKKNRLNQAKAFYIIVVFSLTYLAANFIIGFLTSLK